MSVIIFFSANKNNLFFRNDVQAIDFLRKGSYAPACNYHYLGWVLTWKYLKQGLCGEILVFG